MGVSVLPPKVYAFLCAIFVANGAAIFGYDLVTNYIGFIVSSLLLGAFVGSIPASLIADRFSRRFALMVAGIISITGGILQAACQNKETMLAGRFVGGMATGMLGCLVPLYQSEIAHPSNRGRLTATFQLGIGVGAFVAGWIAYGCSTSQPGTAIEWRVPLALQIVPALPLVFLIYLLPESPRWLMIRGRQDEALINLARLHARGNMNDAFVQGEFNEMRSKVSEEASTDQSWGLIFRDKTNLRKVFYGIILQFSVQLTGVSAIQYYAVDVYRSVGFEDDALLINSINNALGIVGQIVCICLLDRVGRRFPLVFGNMFAGSMFIVATAISKQFADGGGNRSMGIAFVACIYMYNFVFSSCIGPLSWAYPVEIMNTAIRAKATALTSMAAWLSNFMIGQVSPTAFENIGWRYYLVFVVCGFTNALTFYLLFPETKGRTLEEMDQYFTDTHWIVPLSKAAKVGTHARERDLEHEGEAKSGAQATHVDAVQPTR